MPKVTSIRLSDDLAARLDRLAEAIDRPRAWLIDQAIARYLDDEAWQIAAINEALSEYQEGRALLTAHDDLMKRMEEKVRARAVDDAGPLA